MTKVATTATRRSCYRWCLCVSLQLDDVDRQASVDLDSSLFAEEPLYQIYHCGAVLRDVMDNELDDSEGQSGFIVGVNVLTY